MVVRVAESQLSLRQRFTFLELIKLLEDLEVVITSLLEDQDQFMSGTKGKIHIYG